MSKEQISIEDGKYTVTNNNGEVMIYRYNEPWKIGTKFDLCMMQEIQRLQQERDDLENELRDAQEQIGDLQDEL